MTDDERAAAAYERGLQRGQADNESRYYDESPLSGEWAGYSERELLGDLFDEIEREYMIDNELDNEDGVMYWSDFAELSADCDEIAEHYLQGYRAAFHDEDIVPCDSCAILMHREQKGIGSTLIDSGERVYFCSDYCEM